MAKKNQSSFNIYTKGQEVTDAALKAQFGDRYREVLGDRLKQLPKNLRERSKYIVQADLPKTKGEYDSMLQKRFTTTVESLILDAFDEINALGEEMREAFDNTPESLQSSGVGEARGEAADILEGIEQPDIPEICAKIDVYFESPRDQSTRSKRAAAVESMLSSAYTEIRLFVEGSKEEKEENESLDELESLADQLEEIADEIASITFPGMYK